MNKPRFSSEAREANPYCAMTDHFNQGHIRTILTDGQACVYYRLAFQAKDAYWIMRLNQDDMNHVLRVLGDAGARFRPGSSPLSVPWHAGGWSSHLEIFRDEHRLRTDFVSIPPRICNERLSAIWHEIPGGDAPVTGIRDLILVKRTQREKDWPIIGSLSERLTDPGDILLYSTSAQRLLRYAQEHPDLIEPLAKERPILLSIGSATTERSMKESLMMERLDAMEIDRERMNRYQHAMKDWRMAWNDFSPSIMRMPALEANAYLSEKAHGLLPTHP